MKTKTGFFMVFAAFFGMALNGFAADKKCQAILLPPGVAAIDALQPAEVGKVWANIQTPLEFDQVQYAAVRGVIYDPLVVAPDGTSNSQGFLEGTKEALLAFAAGPHDADVNVLFITAADPAALRAALKLKRDRR